MSPIKKYSFIIFGLFVCLPNASAYGLHGSVKEPQIIILTGGREPGKTTAVQNSESSLRTPKYMICKGDALKQECRMMCGPSNYGCIFDECRCLDRDLSTAKQKDGENLPPSKKELNMLFSDFEDLIEVLRRQSNHVIRVEDERPALRHHIAHFCSDLNVARKCIRKCMKLGKPAFCGKDHHCYCGHKYNSHSEDEKIDVTDTYAQFRDLYTKYFGADGGKPISMDNGDWQK